MLPYGDPKSKSTDPSSGSGKGNGIGSGDGTGIGSGEGNGYGPGRGGNTGGGDFRAGGGGPGGGGGGDYSGIFTGKDVTSKARLISKPEPQYTEDARKNQITGTVVLKCVFGSDGQVKNISVRSGLPYGLTEKAIAAASRSSLCLQPRTDIRSRCGCSSSTTSTCISKITRIETDRALSILSALSVYIRCYVLFDEALDSSHALLNLLHRCRIRDSHKAFGAESGAVGDDSLLLFK